MKNKILVVAAHPDDEVLGMGGTILKHVDHDDEVNILILSDGETAKCKDTNIARRKKQAKDAASVLGAKKIILEKFPDNKFDSLPLLSIIKKIEEIISEIRPNIVYTHFPYDLNVDHRLTFQAVLTACRPQPNFCVKKILAFEILSSTEWQIKDSNHVFYPNEYSNINSYIDKKIEVLKIYKDELRRFPHPRSIKGVEILAQYRGMEAGHNYAEAFSLIRNLIN